MMAAMNRFFVFLCVVFSLLLAPMAHAVEPDSSSASHNFTDQSPSKKQDNGNLAAAEHHCIADRTQVAAADDTRQETSSAFTVIGQTNPALVTIRPLLEPPSRA